jgi:hypothetical protein
VIGIGSTTAWHNEKYSLAQVSATTSVVCSSQNEDRQMLAIGKAELLKNRSQDEKPLTAKTENPR